MANTTAPATMNENPMSPGAGEETFQLVWHNYQSNFHDVVGDLLSSEAFADVSLVAEGRLVRAHRLVLSACSPYLHNVLRALPPAPAAHPVLLMPPEVSLPTLRALLDFMYRGVVHVPHAALVAVLHAGDILQVRGLCRGDELQRPPSEQIGSPESPPPPNTAPENGANSTTYPARRHKRTARENGPENNLSSNEHSNTRGNSFDNNHVNNTLSSLGLLRVKEEPYDWSADPHEPIATVDESVFRPTVLLSTKNESTSRAETTSNNQTSGASDDDEEPTPLTCEQCHEVFPRAAAWVRHLQIHPPVARPLAPPPPPPLTPARPANPVNTRTPQQQMIGSHQHSVYAAVRRPHVCGHCGKRFSSRASLGIHGRTHTGETPYTCDLCHKGFNVKSNLLRHLRTLHNRIVSPSDVDTPCS